MSRYPMSGPGVNREGILGGLTLGKLRGIQQISNDAGRLTITALDHRGSLKKALRPADPSSVTFGEMVDFKARLATALVPHSSAILLDPVYGAAPLIAKGAVPGGKGILISLEETGYTDDEGDRVTTIQQGWSVAKIKEMGGSAVKLLLYYNPRSATAQRQEDVVVNAALECRRHDIPLLVEPMTYHISGGPKKGTAEFAALKPQMVIDTAARLVPLGIDVLKAEFPADSDFERDDGRMLAWCRELTDACGAQPWVLLSAGVSYPVFKRQVEIACAGGASGFLAGRAIWQEVPSLSDGERDDFLAGEASRRLDELTSIANESGRAWTDVMAAAIGAVDTSSGWESRYMAG
jgi:tagatose 1,6-diphosphate aldolase